MTAIYYESRVADVKYFLNTLDADSWCEDPEEYNVEGVMLTSERARAIGATPIKVGTDAAVFFTYSGYIDGVKTAIQLAETNLFNALTLEMYDPLTMVLADSWDCGILGEAGESPTHGIFYACQSITGGIPDSTVTTDPGMYKFAIVYTNPSTAFVSTIISGWIEILPAVPS